MNGQHLMDLRFIARTIRELESVKGDFESLEEDHSSVISDLEATQARETAWRLERWNWKRRLSLAGWSHF